MSALRRPKFETSSGIELPNDKREKVYFREMLASKEYGETQARLAL